MKFKSIKTQNRKKSIASLFLALLLMFSFNSTPIIMLANKLRSANAYKSSDSYTYYTSTSGEKESNFSDAQVPSSLKKYFDGSSNNFNLYQYYTDEFENNLMDIVDNLFAHWDGTWGVSEGATNNSADYDDKYAELMAYFNIGTSGDTSTYSLAEVYKNNLSSLNCIKTNFPDIDELTFRDFVEYVVLNGLSNYDSDSTKSLPTFSDKVLSGIDKHKKLSIFYRVLANYTINTSASANPYDGNEEDDNGEDKINNKISTDEAFYTSNTHYVRLKNYIDAKIVKNAPIYAFDATTQDTNIAAIFANNAPSTYLYNYSGEYEEYTTYTKSVQTTTVGNETKRMVYYWGSFNESDKNTEGTTYYKLFNSTDFPKTGDEFNANDSWVLKTLADTDYPKPTDTDIFKYIPIPADEFGHVNGVTTFYQLSSINYEYSSSSTIYNIYVVNDDPTPAELATYESLYIKVITSAEITADADLPFEEQLYVHIPYEKQDSKGNEDERYFKAVYENLLYGISDNQKYFGFENFVSYFTDASGVSKIYFKIKESKVTNTKKVVYIDSADKSNFETKYNYNYKLEAIDKDSSDYDPNDYELIESNSTYKTYLTTTLKNSEDTSSKTISDYKLYFKKIRSYDSDGTQITYKLDEYETEYTTNIDLEEDFIASKTEYETSGSERSLYFLPLNSDFEGDDLKDSDEATVAATKINQDALDDNPNFYVEVPAKVYNDKKIDTSSFKLYYKHKEIQTSKIFVVDDSDNANENKIYKTLNYNVITSTELKNNYTNYLIVESVDENYNENFLLYYKYKRTEDTSNLYVLSSDNDKATNKDVYKTVASGELTDYVLIDRTNTGLLYEAAFNALGFTQESGVTKETLSLYRKLSDVFVQNELKKGNAIYVKDDSVDADDKQTYGANLWTQVTSTELSTNAAIYVAVDINDPNYDDTFKLYYKYDFDRYVTKTNVVYSITDIDTSDSKFDPSAYKLITSGSDYRAGEELYYKKLVEKEENITHTTPIPTYYYYQTLDAKTLSSNSYYVISFYVQTVGDDARASFNIKDTASILSDINLNNLKTNGKWQQYYIFISTDVANSSSINITLRMGDEDNGIAGNTGNTEITGAVFFDEIKITKIGLTDYNKLAIDNVPVYSTPLTQGEGDAKTEVPGAYADKYNNQIFIANSESDFSGNVYDYKTYLNGSIHGFGYAQDPAYGYSWNDMFDFDNASSALKTNLGYNSKSSDESSSDPILNNLKSTLGSYDPTNDKYNITGYDMYNLFNADGSLKSSSNMFTSLWRYYVSRDLGVDGLSLERYVQAYAGGDLDVTITNQIEETKTDDDDSEDEDDEESSEDSGDEDGDEEEDETEEKKDIAYVSNPFNNNNYALKLTNKNKDISLGITSNGFIVEQFGYYKITVWAYSPDTEGTASVSINSLNITTDLNEYGKLSSSSVSSTYANVASSSSSSNAEYGWFPITIYVEGNPYRDMQCYLVLSAGKDSTVYFDNITIEKTTSKIYDNNKTNSSYNCALSLSASDTYDTTGVTNGKFNLVTVTDSTSVYDREAPYTAESWATQASSSSRVTAGIVSTRSQGKFFETYAGDINKRPYEGSNNYSNVFAIYAPSTVEPLSGSTTSVTSIDYKHTYSIYSSSVKLSSSTTYKISFKFYAESGFDGTLFSNIYSSSVKEENILTSLEDKPSASESGKWLTYTYYIAAGTSEVSSFIELGIKNATGLCYFKDVKLTKITTGETISDLMAKVAKENGIDSSATESMYYTIRNARFLDLANLDLSYHTPTENETTAQFDQKLFTDNSKLNDKHTVGKTGVVVAGFYDSVKTTTISVTINKVTYYVGEVYKVKINETDYFVHKTYNSRTNTFNYKLYSDTNLSNEVTKIGEDAIKIEPTNSSIKVTVGSTEIESTNITTTYRLYKFSDLREEVTEIDGSVVSIETPDKVVLGTGSKATDNTTTSSTNSSYIYHFVSDDYGNYIEFNNTIIPASELDNNQSSNVLILANGYSTDYIDLTQTTTRTIGKSAFYTLRVYAKTSDFASSDFGLNIEVEAVNTSWTNINTTKSEEADEYGFVCYEILIRSNSSDSISGFAVKLSLGSEENLGSGYALISKVSLDTFASEDAFNHYLELVDEDNDNIKTAIYDDIEKEAEDEDEDEVDDKNSVSWATFFYIFSSLLLVATTAVALVAVILKKHPLKFAKKYSNAHERDIDSVQTKKSKSSKSKDVVIGEIEDDKQISRSVKDRDETGGII